MGTLFSTLDIATSGLRVSQIQLDVTGHNIANVNKEGFSRQRAELATRRPNILPEGQLGRGVGVDTVQRIRDQFLDTSYRQQVPGLGTADVLANYYALVEDSFLEPGEDGFGTRIDVFFDAMADLANNVEEMPVREAVLGEAVAMAENLNELADRFNLLRTNANEEIRNLVPEINSLSERINTLNERIRQSEFSGQPANDLRDDRDLLVDELARLVDIRWREIDSGEYVILMGSDILVDSLGARQLEAVYDPSLDPERPDLVDVRFVDTGTSINIGGGELFGAFQVRDEVVPFYDQRIDEIAATIIEEINRIHTQGNGLNNLSGTISSTNEVSAPGDPLTAAGLPFTVTPGTFDVVVYDAANNPTTATINVTAATTLNDLATQLNAVAGINASVTGNTLDISNTPPSTFVFANDNTEVLTALGINGFFTGRDARSIAVNQDLLDNPDWISTGYSLDFNDVGDNRAALDMADVRILEAMDGDLSTINEFYESTIATLGVDTRANLEVRQVQERFVLDFDRRRQEVSGVSIDEEVTSLIMYQRAYEASARVVNTTDRMLDALLSLGA